MSTTIASMLYIYKGYKGTQTHTHRSVVQDCPDLIDLSLNGEGIGSLVGWACLACLETCCGPSLQLMLLGLSAAHHIVESDLNSGAMRSHAEPCGAMRSHGCQRFCRTLLSQCHQISIVSAMVLKVVTWPLMKVAKYLGKASLVGWRLVERRQLCFRACGVEWGGVGWVITSCSHCS